VLSAIEAYIKAFTKQPSEKVTHAHSLREAAVGEGVIEIAM
jgi:hypothetical protein